MTPNIQLPTDCPAAQCESAGDCDTCSFKAGCEWCSTLSRCTVVGSVAICNPGCSIKRSVKQSAMESGRCIGKKVNATTTGGSGGGVEMETSAAGLSTGEVAGIGGGVAACALASLLLVGLAVFRCRKSRRAEPSINGAPMEPLAVPQASFVVSDAPDPTSNYGSAPNMSQYDVAPPEIANSNYTKAPLVSAQSSGGVPGAGVYSTVRLSHGTYAGMPPGSPHDGVDAPLV
jgi:hypothetical protein